MKGKIKQLVSGLAKRVLKRKDTPGDPLDLTPGLKISRVVDVTGRTLSFNEISENILRQKEALKR